MDATLEVIQGRGEFGDLVSVSYNDDATIRLVDQGVGDVGSGSAVVKKTALTRLLDRNQLELTDSIYGLVDVTVDQVDYSKNSSQPTISFESILGKLNITVVASPIFGGHTLQDAWNAYLALGFDSAPSVSYTSTKNPTVVFKGWSGNLWQYLNNLAAVFRQEFAIVDGVIVIRDRMATKLNITNLEDDGLSLTINSQQLSQHVIADYYRCTEVTVLDGLLHNWSTNPSFEVDLSGWNTPAIHTDARQIVHSPVFTSEARATTGGAFGPACYKFVVTDGVVTPGPYGGYLHAHWFELVHTFDATPMGDGVNYNFGISIDPPADAAGPFIGIATTVSVNPRVEWFNSSGISMGVTNGTTTFLATAVAGYKRVLMSAIRPAGAVTGTVTWNVHRGYDSTSSTAATGLTWLFDGMMISTQTSYFDGSTSGATWNGTAGKSASTMVNAAANTSFYDARADDNNVISASSGTTTATNVSLLGTPSQFGALVCVTTFPVLPGQYLVSGSDGVPISSQEWADYGGSVTAKIGADGESADIVMIAPNSDIPDHPGPYQLAVATDQVQYATLNISGIGTVVDHGQVTMVTGAPVEDTLDQQDINVDCPFVTSPGVAYSVATEVAGAYSGTVMTGSFSMLKSSALKFGVTPGSYFVAEDSIYRVVSTSYDGTHVTGDVEQYVRGSDFDAIWAGKTGADFDAIWGVAAYDGNDFVVMPLLH